MPYIPPFSTIKTRLDIQNVRGELFVKIKYDELLDLFKEVLKGACVNEKWYREKYHDVDEYIINGKVESALAHYSSDGYFEDRLPSPILVDEKWYLKNNPDVREAIRAGKMASAQAHFEESGYREGRKPFP